jgi:hypothetical protein
MGNCPFAPPPLVALLFLPLSKMLFNYFDLIFLYRFKFSHLEIHVQRSRHAYPVSILSLFSFLNRQYETAERGRSRTNIHFPEKKHIIFGAKLSTSMNRNPIMKGLHIGVIKIKLNDVMLNPSSNFMNNYFNCNQY